MAGERQKSGFFRSEDAAADVEYMLVLAFVILPICVVVPGLIITLNARFFARTDFWIRLPFP